ncbi:hypothetical protein AB36_2850 [Escherichia coli 7-233-03_S1_C2]|nr:hypothetical protein AC06_2463 [Escherichia coli 3-373-03_S3_C1]KDX98152.1 hypothetical protein AB89_0834 [Escherichia coli 2-316-03_S3_C1]KEM62023.1 hypothetical protein AB36_2850 [Escherichia coli 7-233-03_S1_C2]KEM99459.1 hypothetical protein AB68_2895 [Escherichia coli 7-233-03_S1_C3]KEN18264.1 hypothetical protein AC23_4881 [Escherichia coli 7-233-03_S3_C2]
MSGTSRINASPREDVKIAHAGSAQEIMAQPELAQKQKYHAFIYPL